MKKLAKNLALKLARKEKGLTQLQLAKLLGYKGGQSVSNWENGRIKPPLTVASKIARILEKDIDSLFFEDKEQENHT
ncbi:helix-turn-helix transcriptional regulator [Laceyella putida]|uniref:Helix-turn-helix transcriptional regulator n=1 Tax=Laceyella putida TaxID=110101 RepID=A0ABW2RKE2_9BACL